MSEEKLREIAKKALTPEQQEEYKKVGEYMYNSVSYENPTYIKEPEKKDIILYAIHAIKSGLDPKDLSDEEISALIYAYGDKWYKNFSLEESDVRVPVIQVVKPPNRKQRRKNNKLLK